jgi:hypothetical protein
MVKIRKDYNNVVELSKLDYKTDSVVLNNADDYRELKKTISVAETSIENAVRGDLE